MTDTIIGFAAIQSMAWSYSPTGLLSLKKEYVLPALVDQLMHETHMPVEVLETNAVWFGITYHEDKATVQDALKALHDQGDYPESLD